MNIQIGHQGLARIADCAGWAANYQFGNVMKTFGENLERLMKAKGLSGRTLAKQMGVPAKTVQEWIGSGGRMPRNPDALRQLASFFSVSIHELLFGVPDPQGMLGSLLEKTEIHTGLYEITVKKIKNNS